MMIRFLFILLITWFTSTHVAGQAPQPIGCWFYSDDENEYNLYIKCDSFIPNKRGFAFKPNGELLVRQNTSFCGTPPISYDNYRGKWSLKSKSIIKMRYDFWGGEIKCTWRIKELTNDTMVVEETKHQTIYNKKNKQRLRKQKRDSKK